MNVFLSDLFPPLITALVLIPRDLLYLHSAARALPSRLIARACLVLHQLHHAGVCWPASMARAASSPSALPTSAGPRSLSPPSKSRSDRTCTGHQVNATYIIALGNDGATVLSRAIDCLTWVRGVRHGGEGAMLPKRGGAHLDYALRVGDGCTLRPRPVAHGEQVVALLQQHPPQLVQLVEVPAGRVLFAFGQEPVALRLV